MVKQETLWLQIDERPEKTAGPECRDDLQRETLRNPHLRSRLDGKEYAILTAKTQDRKMTSPGAKKMFEKAVRGHEGWVKVQEVGGRLKKGVFLREKSAIARIRPLSYLVGRHLRLLRT